MLGKARLGQRARSPESFVALAVVVASVIVLWPLRDVLQALPGLRYAATLFLFMAPGLLLTRRFLGNTPLASPRCPLHSSSAPAFSG